MNVTTCCKRKREPRFCSANVTVIVELAQPCANKGADENAGADLKNDVICSGYKEILIKSDSETLIFTLNESPATALNGRCECQN